MRKISLFTVIILPLCCIAQTLTLEHMKDAAVETLAQARSITLTGTLEASAPWSTRGGTDWRQLRDVSWQVRHVNLSKATAEVVPDNAFHSRHHLQNILLPQGVREIGTQAFFACDSLEEIVIPASVEYVRQSAFNRCGSLRRVIFEGAPIVEEYAFANCPNLKDIVAKGARPSFSPLAFYGTRPTFEEDLTSRSKCAGQTEESSELHLVPMPAVVRTKMGALPLYWEEVTRIVAPNTLTNEKMHLMELLSAVNTPLGKRRTTALQEETSSHAGLAITLSIDTTLPDEEAYVLDVAADGIRLCGGSPAGVFWGIMTLRQLMLDGDGAYLNRYKVKAVHIEDQPRMHIRELMLDPSRTFIPMEELRKFVPVMARYKYNALHLHLSDDQAWRMEVKKYPLLTKNASLRVGMDDMLMPDPGFYTQKEMKEFVNYAARYHVMVIPELEMPGHEVAAIHAYPQLTCGAKEVPMRAVCGVSNELLCPASEFTFQFLTDVLREYKKIFPAPYVHLGGDEAGWPPLSNWTQCKDCQQLKQRLGITPVDRREDNWRLQKHLFDRVIGILRDELGKTPMYWYEPDFKEIQPGCITFAWRGGQTNMAIESAQKNRVKVMLCPGDHCYLDYPMTQGDMPEVNWGMPVLPLKDTYALEPAWGHDEAFEKETIFGVAGTLWGESINTPERITYQLFPRGFALAEAGWSPQSVRNYDSFLRRIQTHIRDLQREGVSVNLKNDIQSLH